MNINQSVIVKLIHLSYPEPIKKAKIPLLLYLTDCSADPQLTTYRYTKQASGPYTSAIGDDLNSLLENDILRVVSDENRKQYAIDFYTKSQQYLTNLSTEQEQQIANTHRVAAELSRSDLVELIYSHPRITAQEKYSVLSCDATHTL